jgi:hypothetical protein
MGAAKNSGRGGQKGAAPAASKDLVQLTVFLGSELAAVDTYKLALDNLDSSTHARTYLETCLRSHQQRVALLRSAIAELGGTPSPGPGAWAALVEIVESGEVGDKAAVGALEKGEDDELAAYGADLSGLEPRWRQMVQTELVPKQQQSHHTIHELGKSIH